MGVSRRNLRFSGIIDVVPILRMIREDGCHKYVIGSFYLSNEAFSPLTNGLGPQYYHYLEFYSIHTAYGTIVKSSYRSQQGNTKGDVFFEIPVIDRVRGPW